jgi:hypothetical protein
MLINDHSVTSSFSMSTTVYMQVSIVGILMSKPPRQETKQIFWIYDGTGSIRCEFFPDQEDRDVCPTS